MVPQARICLRAVPQNCICILVCQHTTNDEEMSNLALASLISDSASRQTDVRTVRLVNLIAHDKSRDFGMSDMMVYQYIYSPCGTEHESNRHLRTIFYCTPPRSATVKNSAVAPRSERQILIKDESKRLGRYI